MAKSTGRKDKLRSLIQTRCDLALEAIQESPRTPVEIGQYLARHGHHLNSRELDWVRQILRKEGKIKFQKLSKRWVAIENPNIIQRASPKAYIPHETLQRRAEIVELCREMKTAKTLSKLVGIAISSIHDHMKTLIKLEYVQRIEKAFKSGGNWAHGFITIIDHPFEVPEYKPQFNPMQQGLNPQLCALMGYTNHIPPTGRHIKETMPDIPLRKFKMTIGNGSYGLEGI
jgi:hypothetical protein